MGHLSIHCDGCGSDWVVYHRDDWKFWKARTCPVCGKTIPESLWNLSVLKGFNEMEDANLELVKEHEQNHGTLFTVSYVPDVVFPNQDRALDEISGLRWEFWELQEQIDGLEEELKKLYVAIMTIKGEYIG